MYQAMIWISVKDRLPDKDCLAIVSDGRHIMLADWMQDDGWMTSHEDDAFGITPTRPHIGCRYQSTRYNKVG
jgi:hypothetical protein